MKVPRLATRQRTFARNVGFHFIIFGSERNYTFRALHFFRVEHRTVTKCLENVWCTRVDTEINVIKLLSTRGFFHSFRKAQKAMTAGILNSQEISDFKSKMMNFNMGFTSY